PRHPPQFFSFFGGTPGPFLARWAASSFVKRRDGFPQQPSHDTQNRRDQRAEEQMEKCRAHEILHDERVEVLHAAAGEIFEVSLRWQNHFLSWRARERV